MPIETVHLRKLMQLMLAEPASETSLLRRDINEHFGRERRAPGEGGGDFHSAFWADAKGHADGRVNLRLATPARIVANERRRRLYPELTRGFLEWWEERRRLRNEPFEIDEERMRGRLVLDGLGTIRVENNLAFSIVGEARRIIYPYFCEEPEMDPDTARLGLWAMSGALPGRAIEDMRILDVIRGRSFSTVECPQRGTEEQEFRGLYGALLDRWRMLRAQYDDQGRRIRP
ncbi:hypothetical protein [Brevundimonas sp.]|uniref:hypothetical protein n=1 Tax=Brevundimonas sp. TaxID=1871086 RepID=UPI002D24CC36|nr:hypothetical protein [Brevundimonas sp.]HYD28717.1 hypothetical protein [Brevundimonas sp.]